MKDRYLFPAICEPGDSNGYTVTFPDLPGCIGHRWFTECEFAALLPTASDRGDRDSGVQPLIHRESPNSPPTFRRFYQRIHNSPCQSNDMHSFTSHPSSTRSTQMILIIPLARLSSNQGVRVTLKCGSRP